MVVGLREFTLRTEDGSGKPVLDESNGEELKQVQPSVAIVLGNRPVESPGTLYITSRKIIWLSDVDMSKGYAVDFLSISLHAVSRDPEAYSSPCIYTQIDVEEDEDESDTESTEVLDLPKIREMRLVPSDSSQLDTLFDVFCECAELNPEPVEEEEENGDSWVFGADQMDVRGGGEEDAEWQMSQSPTSVIGHTNGDEGLAQPMLELQINDQRFEDAEEMAHDSESKDHH
ncbi:unnamed protein product [Microthlaspi erraticum]|uniref:Chloride conductance regulatory protein ICln n=1 Tax=Microthlaspi erraticum TaxID=1685480 RepID=A0A6D2J5P5_9BRAS|nr:unnamed protein product [Microthlaspi erraticum]